MQIVYKTRTVGQRLATREATPCFIMSENTSPQQDRAPLSESSEAFGKVPEEQATSAPRPSDHPHQMCHSCASCSSLSRQTKNLVVVSRTQTNVNTSIVVLARIEVALEMIAVTREFHDGVWTRA